MPVKSFIIFKNINNMGCSSERIEVEVNYDGEKEIILLEGKYSMTGRQAKHLVQDQYEI